MQYRTPHIIFLFAASITACGDNSVSTSGESGEGSSSSTTSAELPTGDGTSSTSGASSTGADTSSGGTSGTSGPGAVCEGFLCGALLACCAAEEACVAGECAPACASDVRCGNDLDICCADGEICLDGACTPGLGPCTTNAECEDGSYCDPAAGACFAVDDAPSCSDEGGGLAVALEWAFTDDEVIAMPVVVDLDGDAVPEVIVNTTRVPGLELDYVSGEIICLDGASGELLWRIVDDPAIGRFGAAGRATIAAGDVTGDGAPDIVYAGRYNDVMLRQSRVHAIDGEGNQLWTGRDADNNDVWLRIENGAPALVNLDSDPQAEVAFGAAIFDHDGLLVWNQDGQGSLAGSPHNKMDKAAILYAGGLATFADLTGDGYPELLTGREAWSIEWIDVDPPNVTLTQLWQATSGVGGDGWPAVADLDANGSPEVVLVAWPEIKVLDGATGQLWCGVDATGAMCEGDDSLRTQPVEIQPPSALGGPATIADLDGDGRPEIGLTTGDAYRVLDLNRPGEVVVKPQVDPTPAAGAIYTRWRSPAQDKSSAATGSTAFDHDGDGASELFYQDECALRVYDGATGKTLLEVENSTATIHEYPVVADVDGDGQSEVLLVANLSNEMPNLLCAQKFDGWTPRRGVYLYRAAHDDWTTTGSLWTQHTYHVTNADADGNVPASEVDNWSLPDRNDFRAAPHGEAVVSVPNAPDLTVSLAVGLEGCGDSLVLRATVINEGSLGVPAGLAVAFYAGTDDSGAALAVVPTAVGLVPGGVTVVETVVAAPAETGSFYVVVDPEEQVGECFEANNGALVFEAGCAG